MSEGPAFTIGMGSMALNPPTSPDPAEGPTQRAERVLAAQERWVPKDLPGTSPAAVLADMARRDPAFRTSALMQRVTTDPGLIPEAETDPAPGEEPVPGGLWERARAIVAERTSRARHGIG